MKKLNDVACFIKNNIVKNIPDDYIIDDEIKNGLKDADIRKGVKCFQKLLALLVDTVVENTNALDTANDEKTRNTTGFEKIFPDLIYPVYMLYCIGLRGRFDEAGECIYIEGSDLNKAFKEVHGNQAIQYLQFLSDLGFDFSDLDFSINLNKAGMLEIRYPDSKHTLIGLKIMAETTAKTGKRDTDKSVITTVFMRCDYHALALPKKFNFDIRDVTASMPDEYKKFFVATHDYLISENCKCETKYSLNEFIFTYTSKALKATVFSIHISMDYYIKLNSKLINEQSDLLSDAPDSIVNAVKNGWGCAKENDPNACNPKCVNLKFTIDGKEYQKCKCLNFRFLPIDTKEEREYIKTWLSKELNNKG